MTALPRKVLQPISEPLEVMFYLSPESHTLTLRLDPPAKLVTIIKASLPTSIDVEDSPSPSNIMAITVPSADQARPQRPLAAVIIEKTEWDTGILSQACARAFPQIARYLVGTPSLTLQVRVEEDGRVSESRVIMSSGDSLRDSVVDSCVLSHGEYEPQLVEGHAIASWQRIRWIHQDVG